MTTIDNKLRLIIVNKVVAVISRTLERSRIGNIVQNIKMMSLRLLGDTINVDKLDAYCRKVAELFLSSLVSRGKNVGLEAAQSLLQPITQAYLKSQHSAGRKGSSGASSLVKLNALKTSPRVVVAHCRTTVDVMQKWAKDNEYTSFGEVIATPCGGCKYVPRARTGERDQRCVYINVPKMCETFYVFRIDPCKLADIGMTHTDVYRVIMSRPGLGLIIHPPATFTFELCPDEIGHGYLSIFNDRVRLLMDACLKGIRGVERIEIRASKVSDVVKCAHYDGEHTFLYHAPEIDLFFPRDELIKRLPSGLAAEFVDDCPMHIHVNGKVDISDLDQTPHKYIAVCGTMSFKDILKKLSDANIGIRKDCIWSNDPVEMTEHYGITVAQSIHEYNYWQSLTDNGFSLAYVHIAVFCAKMFGYNLCPITPQGFKSMQGITPLDRLAYRDFVSEVSTLPVNQEERFPVRGVIPSVLMGKPYTFGTNYAGYEIDMDARQRVIDMCSDARTVQHYGQPRDSATGRTYADVDFYGVGSVRKITSGLRRTLVLPSEDNVDFYGVGDGHKTTSKNDA